jgi:ElaB/YqjD/DUF883 family membrane-anchored ribosome-binding protein
MSRTTTADLREDLQRVIRDAEELLQATTGQVGEKFADVRARAEESLRTARTRLHELGDVAAARARVAASSADECVRANPWVAVGVGAATGLVLGLLLGRRRD